MLIDEGRVTQVSGRLTLSVTSVLLDGERLDIAIAPQANLFLRDQEGARRVSRQPRR
ncbi:MAG TPA: hypothetical protein VM120_08845 [Bryobacteraceae bacterium]|nr:hypothetical protein [Bryobacteraceae bacterium]